MEGRTAFVIAHRLSTIRSVDQVLVIDGGRIIESGTHLNLLTQRFLLQSAHESISKGGLKFPIRLLPNINYSKN
ncbi:MAG: hypothetical protein U9R53_09980 [Chloroflexota bacterium]|nr:hypothetical protein [Chloroflexota bacterium]